MKRQQKDGADYLHSNLKNYLKNMRRGNNMKEFTLRELTKRGCIRIKEEDFTDDGNRFKILTYKNLRISF